MRTWSFPKTHKTHTEIIPPKNLLKEESKKFGNKYDYSEVNIINVDSDVLIGCPIHGVIPMTPYAHYKSETGCKQCGEMI